MEKQRTELSRSRVEGQASKQSPEKLSHKASPPAQEPSGSQSEGIYARKTWKTKKDEKGLIKPVATEKEESSELSEVEQSV